MKFNEGMKNKGIKALAALMAVAAPFIGSAKEHGKLESKPAKTIELPKNLPVQPMDHVANFTPDQIARDKQLNIDYANYDSKNNKELQETDSLIRDFEMRYTEVMNFKHEKVPVRNDVMYRADAEKLEKNHPKKVGPESIALLPYLVRDITTQMMQKSGDLGSGSIHDKIQRVKGIILSEGGPLGPEMAQLDGFLNTQLGSTVFGREVNEQTGKRFVRGNPNDEIALAKQEAKTGKVSTGNLGHRYGTLTQDEDEHKSIPAILGKIIETTFMAYYHEQEAQQAKKDIEANKHAAASRADAD